MHTINLANRLFMLVLLLLLSGGLLVPPSWMENLTFQIYFTQLALVLLPVLVFVRINRLDWRRLFPLHKLSFRDAFFIILITVLLLPAGSFLNAVTIWILSSLFGPLQTPVIPVSPEEGSLLFYLISIAVLPGITEELLTRGIVLKSYLPMGKSTAIWMSAILFAILHLHPANFWSPLLMGLFFGWAVLHTGTILAGMLGHTVFNALVILLQFSFPQDVPVYEMSLNAADIVWTLPSFLFSAVLLILAFRKYSRSSAVNLESPAQTKKRCLLLLQKSHLLKTALGIYIILNFILLVS